MSSPKKKNLIVRSFWKLLMPGVSLPESPSADPKPLQSTQKTPLREQLYLLCYDMGVLTRRVWRSLLRRGRFLLAPVGHFFCRVWDFLVLRPIRWIRRECHSIREGFVLARERVRAARERSLFLALLQVLALPFMALRRHRHLWRALTQGVMICVSLIALLFVLRYWNNTTFALELVYGGDTIGYISDDSVFLNALEMVEGRVVKTSAEGMVIDREATMTLRPVQRTRVLTESELCDVILRASGNVVTQMSGIYIDGRLEGAMQNHEQAQKLLDNILKKYDSGADTTQKVAEFKNDVQIVDGLYPNEAKRDYETMWNRLTAQDENGRVYLAVQIRSTEIYNEAIPYESITVQDKTKYIGYRGVRTPGEEGERRITADVVYLNGVEQYREILSEEVVKEPVTEVIAVGAYQVNADAKPGYATGSFIWPLPSCRTVYSPFGYRWGKLHAGIDISGNGVHGKEIIASDGGVVREVNTSGWGGGYGLYVIVDHGNGYATVYAHCSEILVTAGQKITQGQLIARVGNTGNSFGSHLHFEIRINGVSVDPQSYV